MRKTVCVALAEFLVLSSLLLAGCGSLKGTAEEQSLALPKPEGAFIFYRSPDGLGGISTNYGLIGADGEVLLPLQYLQLQVVPRSQTVSEDGARTAADRFFMAAKLVDAPLGVNDQRALLYALVSPEGEVLTDHCYRSILQYGERFGAVRQNAAGVEITMLDRQGVERSSEPESLEVWAELMMAAHYALDYKQDSEIGKGPLRYYPPGSDIPAEGLDGLTFLPDGRYWGRVSAEDRTITRLYDAEGQLAGAPEYEEVSKRPEGCWVATTRGEDGFVRISFLIQPGGERMNEEWYHDIETWWDDGRYLLAWKDGECFVLDGISGAVFLTVPKEEVRQVSMLATGDEQYLAFSGSGAKDHTGEKIPSVINLATGEEVFFSNFPGGRIEQADFRENVFLIQLSGTLIELPEEKKNMYKMDRGYYLVNKEGEVLVAYGYFNSCFDRYYLNRFNVVSPRDRYQHFVGVYDSQGRELLPPTYQRLQPLEGYAFYAVRDDSVGIVDLQGNWLYRESKFMQLED